MKKFNFKLESVLLLRENIEKEWEAKLGKVTSELELITNRIDSLKGEILNSRSQGIDPVNYHSQTLYQERLAYQVSQEEVKLRSKELEREEIKKVYLQKSVDRKIIDKLKDKAVKRYNKESLKDEIKFIDEINSSSDIRESLLGGRD